MRSETTSVRAPGRVSVIVPLYDGGRFIEQTLQSVLTQTHTDLEVIVVDDDSSDDGPERVDELARREPRVRLIRTPHSGIASTRNAGLREISADSCFVLLLDQDDVLAPGMLTELTRRLHERPEAVGAYALADFIDEYGRPFGDGWFAAAMRSRTTLRKGRFVPVPANADVRWPDMFVSNLLYPPSAVLLRRRAVEDVGGLSTGYSVADDWDLMLRLLRLGPIIAWDSVQVGYRRHGSNASKNPRRNVRETRAVWANTYYSPLNSPAQKTALVSSWRAHQRATAQRKLGEAWKLVRSRHAAQAATRAIDGLAHRILLCPLPSWRTDIAPQKTATTRPPLVSVIVPAYMHEEFIADSLRALAAQSYRPLELLIIDDASSDGTAAAIADVLPEVADSFERVDVQIRTSNNGLVASLNEMLASARGKYLFQNDSNDLAEIDAISTLVAMLEGDPRASLAVGDNAIIDQDGVRVYWGSDHESHAEPGPDRFGTVVEYLRARHSEDVMSSSGFGALHELLRENHVPNGKLMRARTVRRVGGWREGTVEDWDLNFRLAERSRLLLVDRVLMSYRWHTSNTIKDPGYAVVRSARTRRLLRRRLWNPVTFARVVPHIQLSTILRVVRGTAQRAIPRR